MGGPPDATAACGRRLMPGGAFGQVPEMDIPRSFLPGLSIPILLVVFRPSGAREGAGGAHHARGAPPYGIACLYDWILEAPRCE